MHTQAPVVTIDGPSGVGKGTISLRLALHFGFHWLDSGAIYRALAIAATQAGISTDQEPQLTELARTYAWSCTADTHGAVRYTLDGTDITQDIRTEQCGSQASALAVLPSVRQALLLRQRDFQQLPGLIAEGRDMGTVVFPNALIKLYLTASTNIRANRRYKQLQQLGKSASIRAVRQEMKQRDLRDSSRDVAPLLPASDAILIDTSKLTIDQVCSQAVTQVTQSLAAHQK